MIDKEKIRVKPDRNRKIYKPKNHKDRPTEITKEK